MKCEYCEKKEVMYPYRKTCSKECSWKYMDKKWGKGNWKYRHSPKYKKYKRLQMRRYIKGEKSKKYHKQEYLKHLEFYRTYGRAYQKLKTIALRNGWSYEKFLQEVKKKLPPY